MHLIYLSVVSYLDIREKKHRTLKLLEHVVSIFDAVR